MAAINRDPNNVAFDLERSEPCPCGSSRLLGECCLKTGRFPYKLMPRLFPPAPRTGHSHPRCYLSFTCNCSTEISREHYISKSILQQLPEITFSGLPWADGSVTVGINSLAANILCKRHNSSLSPLDTEAGNLFRYLSEGIAYATEGEEKSIRRQALLNGHMIELWAHKTALGVYFAMRNHANAPISLKNARANVEVFVDQLRGITPPAPAGLWTAPQANAMGSPSLCVLTASDSGELWGLNFTLGGIPFSFYLPSPVPVNSRIFADQTHRPIALRMLGPKGESAILLTWRHAQGGAPQTYTVTA